MKARIVSAYGEFTAEMRLKAGAKGTGETLHTVQYWPEYNRSELQAYLMCLREAERLDYKVPDEATGEYLYL